MHKSSVGDHCLSLMRLLNWTNARGKPPTPQDISSMATCSSLPRDLPCQKDCRSSLPTSKEKCFYLMAVMARLDASDGFLVVMMTAACGLAGKIWSRSEVDSESTSSKIKRKWLFVVRNQRWTREVVCASCIESLVKLSCSASLERASAMSLFVCAGIHAMTSYQWDMVFAKCRANCDLPTPPRP